MEKKQVNILKNMGSNLIKQAYNKGIFMIDQILAIILTHKAINNWQNIDCP